MLAQPWERATMNSELMTSALKFAGQVAFAVSLVLAIQGLFSEMSSALSEDKACRAETQRLEMERQYEASISKIGECAITFNKHMIKASEHGMEITAKVGQLSIPKPIPR